MTPAAKGFDFAFSTAAARMRDVYARRRGGLMAIMEELGHSGDQRDDEQLRVRAASASPGSGRRD
jgi:hypothetical protein